MPASDDICNDCGSTATTCWDCKDAAVAKLTRERDEARQVARWLLADGQFHIADVADYEDAHPWLKEADE